VSGDVTTDNTGAFTIAANAVGSSKMRLTNAQPLRGRNAANSADVSILEINASNNVSLLDATGTQASIDITNRLLVSSVNNVNYDFETNLIKAAGVAVFNVDTSTLNSGGATPAINFADDNLVKLLPTVTSTARAIEFQNGAGTFGASIKAPALTASYTLTLPPNDGASGEVLRTDGSGVLTWVSNAGITLNRQTFVLDSTDITNQFITLSGTPIANSVTLAIKGAGATIEGASYDFTTTGAQLDFLNDLATAGAAALVVGDVLQVSFAT
jgi:hypothetical protein